MTEKEIATELAYIGEKIEIFNNMLEDKSINNAIKAHNYLNEHKYFKTLEEKVTSLHSAERLMAEEKNGKQ